MGRFWYNGSHWGTSFPRRFRSHLPLFAWQIKELIYVSFSCRTLHRLCAALILAICPLALEAQSQANMGAIEGIVTDASGSVVPKAEVALVNEGTNFTRSLT